MLLPSIVPSAAFTHVDDTPLTVKPEQLAEVSFTVSCNAPAQQEFNCGDSQGE
jgi:hypothetical protein